MHLRKVNKLFFTSCPMNRRFLKGHWINFTRRGISHDSSSEISFKRDLMNISVRLLSKVFNFNSLYPTPNPKELNLEGIIESKNNYKTELFISAKEDKKK